MISTYLPPRGVLACLFPKTGTFPIGFPFCIFLLYPDPPWYTFHECDLFMSRNGFHRTEVLALSVPLVTSIGFLAQQTDENLTEAPWFFGCFLWCILGCFVAFPFFFLPFFLEILFKLVCFVCLFLCLVGCWPALFLFDGWLLMSLVPMLHDRSWSSSSQ